MSKAKDLISIVTITYNHEDYIAEAIESFLMQNRDKFDIEIIVADDASTDGTQKIISKYAKKYPELIRPILRKKNLGVRDNLLTALESAKGKYIALCEGDDFWTSELKLLKQYEYMESDQNAGLCFHLVNVTSPGAAENGSVFPGLSVWSKFDLDELLDHNFIQTNSVMYKNRKNYANIVEGDPLPLDWFLHILHAKEGGIGFIPEVLSTYRRHENGVWWRTDSTQNAFWRKNILKLMTAYENIINLFEGDERRQRIVEFSRINQIVRILENEDTLDGASAIEQVNAARPDLVLSGAQLLLKRIELLEEQLKLQVTANKEQQVVISDTQGLVRQRDQLIEKILDSRMYKIGHAATAPVRVSKSSIQKVKSIVSSNTRDRIPLEYQFSYSSDGSSRDAVIVHLYYQDMWHDISDRLSVLSRSFDLYLSVTEDLTFDIAKINEFHRETNVIKFPNRGRDVLPFLMIAKRILRENSYKSVLKLHTKKSKHRQDGGDWFNDILDELLPNDMTKIYATLDKSDTGVVGPSKQVVSLSRYLGANADNLAHLIRRMYGKDYAKKVMGSPDMYPFIGGTMFWARADFFKELCKLSIVPDDFEAEDGQVDGTLAHAIERALGMSMHRDEKQMYVVESKGDVRKLDKKSYTETYIHV